MDGVRFDVEFNDETEFSVAVHYSLIELSPEAKAIEDKDEHVDFSFLKALDLAIEAMKQERTDLMHSLSRSYPNAYIPELDA
jgi:hypothetical protein